MARRVLSDGLKVKIPDDVQMVDNRQPKHTWKIMSEHYTDEDVEGLAQEAAKKEIEFPSLAVTLIRQYPELFLFLMETAWLDGYITRSEGR